MHARTHNTQIRGKACVRAMTQPGILERDQGNRVSRWKIMSTLFSSRHTHTYADVSGRAAFSERTAARVEEVTSFRASGRM